MNQHINNHSLTQAFLDSKTISKDQICVPPNLEEFILNIEDSDSRADPKEPK